MEPFQVLGKLYPDLYKELKQSRINFPSSKTLEWEIRTPDHNTASAIHPSTSDDVTGWHRDNWGNAGALILWSNVYPTEFLLPDGSMVSGEPYDIVLAQNAVVQHRISSAYVDALKRGESIDRWFGRLWLNNFPTWQEIDNWKRMLAH